MKATLTCFNFGLGHWQSTFNNNAISRWKQDFSQRNQTNTATIRTFMSMTTKTLVNPKCPWPRQEPIMPRGLHEINWKFKRMSVQALPTYSKSKSLMQELFKLAEPDKFPQRLDWNPVGIESVPCVRHNLAAANQYQSTMTMAYQMPYLMNFEQFKTNKKTKTHHKNIVKQYYRQTKPNWWWLKNN